MRKSDLYTALQDEAARCVRWYGESALFTALAAWAEDVETRLRRLEAVPEVIESAGSTEVIVSKRPASLVGS